MDEDRNGKRRECPKKRRIQERHLRKTNNNPEIALSTRNNLSIKSKKLLEPGTSVKDFLPVLSFALPENRAKKSPE